MQKTLKLAAQDFLNQEKLNDEKLEYFENILRSQEIEKNTESEKEQPQNTKVKTITSRVWAGLAATIMVGFMGHYVTLFSSGDMSQAIVNEVAMNHIKMKPLEINTKSIDELRRYFTALDFSLAHSSIFKQPLTNMLGGRYCSIQGITAAQLRYQTADGQKSTLYEAPYYEETHGSIPNIDKNETPINTFIKGLKVTLWVEKGILMASTEELKE
ncbi:MAG: hypothetical protein ACI9Y1_003092 [Lentisphaeria bacterium]|jgi:hypothetical protein